MDPIREQIERMTRRHFFGRTGLGLGTAALASLLAERACAETTSPRRRRRPRAVGTGGLPGLPHFPAEGQAGDLPVHERRPVADGPVRLQAQDGRPVRQGPARLDPQGPAADHHDQRPGPVPDRAFEVQVRPARPVGHVGQRALALDGQARRRHRAGQDGLDRGDQPRPGGHLYLHRQPAPGPAQPGLVAELRPGHDEPEPAGLRGDDRVVVEQGRAQAIYNRLWGTGLPAHASTRASRCARRATRCCSSPTPPGSTPRPAAARSTPSTGSTSTSIDAVRRPRDPGPDRPVRDGLPDADLGARADRHLERAQARSRHVRARRPQAGHLRPLLPAGPPPGRARRPVRPDLPPRLGPARQPGRRPAAASARTSTRPASRWSPT